MVREAFLLSSLPLLAETLVAEPDSLFALDVVRQRLHEKIREARGQVSREAAGVQGAVLTALLSLLCLEEKVPWCSMGLSLQLCQPLWGCGRDLSCSSHPCSRSCQGLGSFVRQEISYGLHHLRELLFHGHPPCTVCAGYRFLVLSEGGPTSSLREAAFAEPQAAPPFPQHHDSL